MGVTVNKINYAGWPNCFQITDGCVETIATTDVGPRLIRLGFCGEPNCFAEFAEQAGRTGDDKWNIYGGHRLWHSPESFSRTYVPDNSTIAAATILPNGIHLRQTVEPDTHIEKEIIVTLNEKDHRFAVEHRVTNRGVWPISCAPWALSVMKAGGVGIVPQYRKRDPEGALPNRVLSLWDYSDMKDPRIIWGSNYILVQQDPNNKVPVKFGLTAPDGWMAYANDNCLFITKFSYNPDAAYPDGGVNTEIFTNDRILELETLGMLQTVPPGNTVSHTENWSIHKGIGNIASEADVEKTVLPLVLSI